MSTCLLATPPRVYNLATTTITSVVAKMGGDYEHNEDDMDDDAIAEERNGRAAVYRHLPLQATISAPKTQSGFSASTPHLIFAFFCT